MPKKSTPLQIKEILDLSDKSAICGYIAEALPDWADVYGNVSDYKKQMRDLPFYAAFYNGLAVGFAAIKPHNPFTAEIFTVCVLDEYRRQGVGKRLIAECERYCIENKTEILTVRMPDKSRISGIYEIMRLFYLSMGFRPVEFSPLPWDKSNPCIFMVKYIRKLGSPDITNTRIKEIETLNAVIRKDLEEKKQLLFQNELQLAKLQLVVKSIKIGLWDTEFLGDDPFDPTHIFVWSEDFRQLLGFENERDFPNLLGSWSSRIHPDDKEKVFDAIRGHLSDTTGKNPLDVEYRMMKKNGEYAYFRTMGSTVWDETGRPARIVGSQLDVTEIRNLINEAENRRIEAEEANKAKSSFLSTVSHEIRTPMNAILGIAEIELMNEKHPPGIKAAFEKIFSSGDMLMGIINDILDLSKIESGKFELIVGKYALESLVGDTAQLNMMRIGSKPIKFELNIDKNMPAYLSGDELRVKQILNNLLSNAFKYTDEGRVILSLTEDTNVSPNGKIMLVIKVSDTGQGMTEEQLGQLFDEYSRFNKAANRQAEGTGLGMSITSNLVHLMGGDIAVTSKPAKGSVFTVRLPQDRVGSEILGSSAAENLKRFHTSSNAKLRRAQISREPMPYGSVLVVDDVDTNIHVARGLLAPYQLQIDSCESGFSAIEKVKNGKTYDIIFMDHMMPKMDGIVTTKHLRNMGYALPIVALTANAVVGQLDVFLENGFDDFISKPIDIRLLNIVLNKFVRDKHPGEVVETAEMDKRHKQAPIKDGVSGQLSTLISEEVVSGLDIAEGLEQFGGNEESYINILRSYTANTRKLIAEIDTFSKADIDSYEIVIHGIKGSSYGICAKPLGDLAAELENAAKLKDSEYIIKHNPIFLKTARQLVGDIEALIVSAGSSGKKDAKPIKDKPDGTLLQRLAAACDTFDMGEVDLIMGELNEFQYESDCDLVDWLQKNVELVNFDEIVQRLYRYKLP